MHILLFIMYGALLGYALTKLPFLRKSGIRAPVLIAFFGLRVGVGCLHSWIAWRYFPGHGDIWVFFRDSFITRQELYTGFHTFWADNGRLADLPHNLIEWMHVVFNYLSVDNLYINTLFFAFLTLGGHIALFLVLYRRSQQDLLSALCALVLPSVLFWTSSIHTEGLIYALLGWLIYYVDRLLTDGWNTRRVLRCCLIGGLAILLRPALAVGLIPALGCWVLAERYHSRRQRFGMALAGIIFLCAGCAALSSSVLAALSSRQAAFQALKGGSKIFLPALAPTGSSFWHVLPTALFNGLFQPVPGSGGQAIYGLFSAELAVIWIGVAAGALTFFVRKTTTHPSPLSTHHSPLTTLPFLLLVLPCMLLIGYIVPFVGAIIRYRSIYLPFLLFPFLHQLTPYRGFATLNTGLKRIFFKESASVPAIP